MRRHLLLFVPLTLFAAGPPRFARLSDFQGAVEVQLRAGDPWIAAERNLPLPESAWVRTGAASRVEIELDEGSAVRAGANSQFEISDCSRLSTGQRVTMITLDHGIAYLTGRPEGRDALSVAVPGAQAALAREAHIRVEVQEQWSQIAAIEGSVRFSSPAAEFELREGQTTRVEPANPARFFPLSRSAPERSRSVERRTRSGAGGLTFGGARDPALRRSGSGSLGKLDPHSRHGADLEAQGRGRLDAVRSGAVALV